MPFTSFPSVFSAQFQHLADMNSHFNIAITYSLFCVCMLASRSLPLSSVFMQSVLQSEFEPELQNILKCYVVKVEEDNNFSLRNNMA